MFIMFTLQQEKRDIVREVWKQGEEWKKIFFFLHIYSTVAFFENVSLSMSLLPGGSIGIFYTVEIF